MPNDGYFDCKRDNEFIASGTHFWCETCMMARPVDDRSPDPRYCQNCFDFLLKEAEMLSPKQGHPDWIPQPQKAREDLPPLRPYPPLIMATVKGKESEVAIIATEVNIKPLIKRGPKRRADLPVEQIIQWGGEGMGSKKITTKLKAEYNIKVGFRTIARILSGQRLMPVD